MKDNIEKMIKDLESINRDPTNYRYYKIWKSAKVIRDWYVRIEISPESEFFEKYTLLTIIKIRRQFYFN